MESGKLKEENENNSQLDKQTVHSQLPKDWEIKKLGEVCEVGAGNSAPQKKEFFLDGIFPFIRTSDVGKIRKGIIDSSIDYLNDEGIKKMRLFKKGTILFPKSGASTFLNHRVIMNIDGYVSSHLATIKPSAVLKNEFIWYYLILIDAKDLMQNVAYPSLKLSDIKQIKIPIPPLPEQKRIVSILDRAFEAIDQAKANAEQNLKNAKELFQSKMQSIFENGKLKVESGEWEEKKLGDVSIFSQGIQVGLKKHLTYPKDGYVRFIRIIDYTQNTDDIRYVPNPGKKYYVNENDIVMIRYGTPGLIGRGKSGVIANNLFRIKINVKSISNDFLVLYLSQRKIQKKLSTQGSATMPALNFRQLKTVIIYYPKSTSEQKQIVQKLDQLQGKTKKLEAIYQQKIDDLEELKKSILQKAFSGQLIMENE